MSPSRSNELPDANLAAAFLRERHEVRYPVRIEIEVSGIDEKDVFRESTFTRDVSAWGCSFWLSVELKPNDIVLLRAVGSGLKEGRQERRSAFQIVRVKREGRGWLLAAWKLEDQDLWGAEIEKVAPNGTRRESRKTAKVKCGRRSRKT